MNIVVIFKFFFILNKYDNTYLQTFHDLIITHFIELPLSCRRPQESTPLLLDLRDISGPEASCSSKEEESLNPG